MAKPGEPDQLTKSLGKVLADRRREAGLTQERLAYRCKLHPTSISHIERGVNSPTVRVLVLLSRELDVSVSALLAEAEARRDRPAG